MSYKILGRLKVRKFEALEIPVGAKDSTQFPKKLGYGL